HSDTRLMGRVDLETIRSVPDTFTVKGMFFRRAAKLLGSELSKHREALEVPTERYLTFRDYPQRDHALLSYYAAIAAHPGMSQREALRQYAKDDIHDFADSIFGKVTMSMVGDPVKALGLIPSVYNKVAPGPWEFTRLDEDGDFILRIGQLTGDWSYQVGQFEGIVAFYGGTSIIEVDDDYPSVTFRVRLT
ncbi:MAG: hypothetical protein ACI9KE_006283, partial [Polyangiales bacterium]